MRTILATASNLFFGLNADDQLESVVELIIHASEPKGEYVGRKLSAVDNIETLRFVASAEGLRDIAKQLVEYADAADLALGKVNNG